MKLANRMKKVKGSEIRNVGKRIGAKKDKNIIKFSAGMPDEKLFPITQLKEATERVWNNRGTDAVNYGFTRGEDQLIDFIKNRLITREKINISDEQILITTGCQQGIALSSMALLDKGDVVVVENPSYLDGLNACIPFECDFVGIDTDDDGMIIEDLKKLLELNDRVKMIYVIPNFQNPSGKAWSTKRRSEFMALINQYDVTFIKNFEH